ncbi:MAG: hypothetical protein DSY77_08180 [Bacteroidetes bacterium]|nr:MAG: hypothetical protein DSY77_08180 [Bacteroidota bacterium]
MILNTKIKISFLLPLVIILLLILASSSKFIIIFNVLAYGFFLIYTFKNQGRVYFTYWIILLILVYLPFLIYGIYNNPDFHIDFKFHLFSLLFLIIMATILGRMPINKVLKILFIVNIVIFATYLILTFLPISRALNPYARGTAAGGYGYRIEGPDIISFSLYAILYLYNRRSWDIYLVIMLLTGTLSAFLNGSLQGLIIIVIVYSLVFVKKTKYIFLFPLILFLLLKIATFTLLPFANEKYKEKITYLSNPLEYPTIKHRLMTLDLMLKQTTDDTYEILFGSGVGVKSTYFEKNEVTPSLSRERTFLEIDNGFFYVYHRAGLFGLALFLLFHLYILFFANVSFNLRIALFTVFLVTNLLSIHYFTTAAYSLLILIPFYKIREYE